MRINFLYEHKDRSLEISKELIKRGHSIEFLSKNKSDVLVIDDVALTQNGKKIVLLDGREEDVKYADASISSFVNTKAQYKGIDYIVLPHDSYTAWSKYNSGTQKKSVFVSLGVYDDNILKLVMEALDEMKLNTITTNDIGNQFSRTEVFSESNYYDAMRECLIGITNGGLIMFQALFYGLPIIVIPQCKRQQINVRAVGDCCLSSKADKEDIKEKVRFIMGSEYIRTKLSIFATNFIDGKGTKRICSLIEGVCDERAI